MLFEHISTWSDLYAIDVMFVLDRLALFSLGRMNQELQLEACWESLGITPATADKGYFDPVEWTWCSWRSLDRRHCISL